MTLFIESEASMKEKLGQVIYIAGAQWGDEGKGKLVDVLSGQYDLIVRSAGGANAGHTIYLNQNGKSKKFSFHLMPSGILRENKICIIGNGTVVHIPTLIKEVQMLEDEGVDTKGRILISDKAHLLLEYHKIIDGIQEDSKKDKKVGTTKRGIGPAYSDKISRRGLRIADLYDFKYFKEKLIQNIERHQRVYEFEFDIEKEIAYYEEMRDLILSYTVNTTNYLNKKHKEGKSILVEGAQGSMLDIDHGTYPYVTSSNTTTGGACTGTSLSPRKIDSVIGILKAYTTRVGEGPMPSELENEMGEKLREQGGEYGTTTGRPRRCGWLDLVVAKEAINVNGINSINLTKLDVLTGLEEIKIVTQYELNGKEMDYLPSLNQQLKEVSTKTITLPGWKEDISKVRSFEELPENAQNYVLKIEEILETRINFIGVGVHREDMIYR